MPKFSLWTMRNICIVVFVFLILYMLKCVHFVLLNQRVDSGLYSMNLHRMFRVFALYAGQWVVHDTSINFWVCVWYVHEYVLMFGSFMPFSTYRYAYRHIRSFKNTNINDNQIEQQCHVLLFCLVWSDNIEKDTSDIWCQPLHVIVSHRRGILKLAFLPF